MTKLLISLYVLVILMIAGFAHASDYPLHTEVIPMSQIPLNVSAVTFDQNDGLLTISGPISENCAQDKDIQPLVRFSTPTRQLYVSVNSNPGCVSQDTKKSFHVVIDLNAYFAQHPVAQNMLVHLDIENFGNSFNYLARRSAYYAFDKKINGVIRWNSNSKEFVLKTSDKQILPLYPTLDLKNYENQVVRVSGLISNDSSSHLFIGQLVTIK